MQHASANLEFECAALLRDQIIEVKSGTGLTKIEPKRRPVAFLLFQLLPRALAEEILANLFELTIQARELLFIAA